MGPGDRSNESVLNHLITGIMCRRPHGRLFGWLTRAFAPPALLRGGSLAEEIEPVGDAEALGARGKDASPAKRCPNRLHACSCQGGPGRFFR